MKRRTLLFALALIASAPVAIEAQNCYESSVVSPTPFMGNNDEIFRLTDGSIWQVKYEYGYLYAYYPSVIICPTRGTLLVDDKSLNVVALTGGGGSTQASFESYIMSKFDGLEYGNLYQLANGQVWEQVESWIWIWVWVWVNPGVLIWNDGGVYRMKVENIDHAVAVRRVTQ